MRKLLVSVALLGTLLLIPHARADVSIACLVLTSPPTYTAGQQVIPTCDTGGHLSTAGAGTGGASPVSASTTSGATAITPVVSTAAENNHIVKASAGNLYSAYAVNTTATAGFLILVNQATVPATGAITNVLDFCVLPASGQCSINSKPGPPTAYSAGVVALISSGANPFTYTTGTVTAAVHVEVQ